jgi:cytochrome bd-type quinol oxidase subunit 2
VTAPGGASGRTDPVSIFGSVMPPLMRILARGIALVLGATAALAAVAGAVAENPLVALNAFGFVGLCALAATTVFYSVALERIGLHRARHAATTLITVLAGSAGVMAAVFLALVTQERFRAEAARFGYHSVAGLVVLAVLGVVLAVLWHDR